MPSAIRRFRLPIPVRVQVHEGRPVRVKTDRRGMSGGAVVQSAGPWRTSGEWWNDISAHSGTLRHENDRSGQAAPFDSLPLVQGKPHLSHPSHPSHPPPLAKGLASYGETCWDRDEWDVAMAVGIIYRLFVERDVGHWFIEGVVD